MLEGSLYKLEALIQYARIINIFIIHNCTESPVFSFIPKIYSQTGVPLINPVEINKTFKQYYSKLYSSESDDSLSAAPFDNFSLPPLPSEYNNPLGGEISNSEILQTIKSLKCSKTPGPDSYTSDFFKEFGWELCPLLQAMFNEFLS